MVEDRKNKVDRI